MYRFVAVLALAACTQETHQPTEALPVEQAAVPLPLTWNFQGYFIKGVNTTISVQGGPTAGAGAFLVSLAAAGPPACPAPFAPECLQIPNPASVFQTRSFAAGSTSFNINVPAAAPPTQVWVQAVGLQGPLRYATPGVRAELLVATADFDSDGISNIEEALTFRTNPLRADSDNDGFDDGDELGVGSDPLDADTDGDGLGDGDEVFNWNTSPTHADSDNDGLSDFDELQVIGTNPNDTDSDDDGLDDGSEVDTHLTDPTNPDTDGGGLPDGDEIAAGKNPLNAADDAPPPTFAADIYPRISLVRCAGCHTGGGASGGFNQDVYANWLAPSRQVPAVRRVTPGNPAASYVWHKVNGTQASVGGFGSRMPLGGVLTPDEIALIEAWILAGAPQF